ncbi:uncharacterized protein TNCV_3970571 [Trichonephila clavipes]|nr:uncharacterized protein TNCV_3970571 [Trichonephila clavipes]
MPRRHYPFTNIRVFSGIRTQTQRHSTVSSLAGNRTTCAKIERNHVSESPDSPIFCTFPRPPEVDRLRQLASGPSPPAFIPSHKVAPEADGEPREVSNSAPTATHIYCQPLPIVPRLYTNPHETGPKTCT